jgi:flagellar biosynthetic protein FlhB
MADENDSGSKTEEPTKHKLDEARAKGDVGKSTDVPAAAVFAAAGAVVISMGGLACRQMTASLLPFIAHPDAIDLTGAGAIGVGREALMSAQPALWVLLAAAVAGVSGHVLQTGFQLTPNKLAPDFSRLSPMKGLERLFGLDGWINFAKSVTKICGLGWVAWMVLHSKTAVLQNLASLDPVAILPLCAEALKALFIAVVIVMSVIALIDFVVQKQRFLQRMRMTKEDIKDETKSTEGDPHIKAKLRQLRMMRSRQRIIQQVPKATLVVMNPTHYAVALRYVQGETPAPICVAKGVDALALKIRAVAEEHKIAVVEDPPLARALYASMEIDQTIPREHYEAVAKIVGFVMGKRKPRPATPRPSRLGQGGL